jgi:hypothetical protein
MIEGDLPACVDYRFEVATGRAAGADAVENDAHLDAGSRAGGESRDKAVGDLARLEDVRLEVDCLPGAANRFQLGGMELSAVGEDVEAGVAAQPAVGERFDGTQELLLADVVQFRTVSSASGDAKPRPCCSAAGRAQGTAGRALRGCPPAGSAGVVRRNHAARLTTPVPSETRNP